ncbi:MAG: hypothetical protein R3290_00020 [Acidimicrobiia bacterium]|nr:hypothetical protein [Acidimicrobiia bacterium]
MTAPLELDPVDARRLLLDGLLDGLPPGTGLAPGRTVVAASALEDLAGTLVSEMRPGDPPRRLAVVADLDPGPLATALRAFGDYVGAAAELGVLELGDPSRDAAALAHRVGAVPFVDGTPSAAADLRAELGAAVGVLVGPGGVAHLGGHDLPVRLPRVMAVRPGAGGPGLLATLGAAALAVDGARREAEALLAERDPDAVRLERRVLRWRDRAIPPAVLRAARLRIDGVRTPTDVAALVPD